MNIPEVTDEQKQYIIKKQYIKEYLIKDWVCSCLINWARIQNPFDSDFVSSVHSIIISKESCLKNCNKIKDK